jgi:hypothetical protein
VAAWREGGGRGGGKHAVVVQGDGRVHGARAGAPTAQRHIGLDSCGGIHVFERNNSISQHTVDHGYMEAMDPCRPAGSMTTTRNLVDKVLRD